MSARHLFPRQNAMSGLNHFGAFSAPTVKAAVSSPHFDPTLIPNLLAWFRADSSAFTDTARTIAVANDGDVVGGWADLSGNANHAQQGTGSLKPLWKTGIQNGLPGVKFDGTDDYIFADAVAVALSGADIPYSIVFACRPVSIAGTGTWASFGSNASGTPKNYHAQASGNHFAARTDDVGSTVSRNPASKPYVAGTSEVSAWVFAGTTLSSYQNGSAIETAVPYDVTGVTVDQFTLGRRREFSGLFQPINGYIFEFLIFSRAISNTERQTCETGLRTWWGI